MPIDKAPPAEHYRLTFDIDSIGNGYLVRPQARPSAADPMAQRGEGPPFYIREIDDAGEAVAHMIEQMKEAQASMKRFHESLHGGTPVGEEDEG